MLAIVRLPKPVIAEVHGVATAAGCQLVASCDLAVAAEDARFATPGRQYRPLLLDPDGGVVARGRAQGGDGDAADRRTDRRRAGARDRARQPRGAERRIARWRSTRWPGEIAGKSAFTVAIGKEAFYRQAELDLAAAYRYAAEVMTTNMLAADAGEGIDAFLAKRPPVWQDR